MRFPRFVPLYVFFTLSTLHLLAQSPDGNVNGLVSDPSSAAVVGAEIVAVNDVTGVQYTTKTNNDGIYVLPNLPPGPYRVQVSKVGFKTVIKPDIVLNVQDALSINFTLPIGAAYEVLTVEGGAPLVNTESAVVSTVVDPSYVQNMPLNGRSFQDLILLTPGVVTQTPQTSPGGEFSVNGQRTASNYYTVDGVSANIGAQAGVNQIGLQSGISGSAPAATALGTTQALVSVDDLQEFRVQSSTYSAQYGRNPGGQFAFETKSGANQWHGSAYEYLRNGFFDAQDWFNDYFATPAPALRQNDFGGTFGGPVKIPGLFNGTDKTFFFASYEGLRLTNPQAASINYVPDSALKSSAPTAVQAALNAFPMPNGPDLGNGIAEFIASWSNPASLDSTSVRFDHAINERLKLFFRFSNTVSDAAARGTATTNMTPTVDTISAFTTRTYTLGATSVFTARLANTFRLNYSSNETTNTQVIDAFGGSTPLNLARLSDLGSGSTSVFALDYGAFFFTNLLQQQAAGAQRQWNLVDAVNFSLGRHQIKFGVDYRRLAPFALVPSPFIAYLYLGESAVTNNTPEDVAQSFGSAYPLYKNFSAFLQDEWKTSARLSLSMGLRWEVNPPPGVTQGLEPYTIQGSGPDTWALAPQGTRLWRTSWYNFAPRLGFAYVIHDLPGREAVVRGGAGVFFDTGQNLGSLGFQGPGFSQLAVFFDPFPANAAMQAPVMVNPPVAPYSTSPYGFEPHLQLPYTLQWNVSIEQALGKSQALSVSYVASHAAKLLQFKTFEPTDNPNSSEFEFIDNGLTSDYGSLQAQFRRRFSQGLTALASYTWSHCIDYASGDYRLGYERGNCDFDVRHNVSTAFSYDLPELGHNPVTNGVLHRWGIDGRLSARTAFPVTFYGNYVLQQDFQAFFEGLNFVPGQPVYLYGTECASVLQAVGDLQPGQRCPGGRAINPNAFTAPPTGLGDAPRNFARGFAAWQMNLAVRREFPIHDRVKLQFRAEAFNVFNHPNFGTINGEFAQSTFGQATATLANSLPGLNPLYQMGGSRSMQFALKLVF